MWIEISHAGKRMLFNSKLVTLIDTDIDTLKIQLMGTGAAFQFIFETREQLLAYYEGLILALNGLDFHFDATEELPAGYIRPLLQTKNESLHRHLMLREVLADRR